MIKRSKFIPLDDNMYEIEYTFYIKDGVKYLYELYEIYELDEKGLPCRRINKSSPIYNEVYYILTDLGF